MSQIDRVLRSNLRLRHLQLLVALDEFRHLGRAADFLALTQPAVSKMLAEVERMYGVALFTRSTRGTEPTAAGAVAVRFARSVLADHARTHEAVLALDSGAAGRVAVGSMVVAFAELVHGAIARLKASAPGATVLVEEGDLTRLLPRLRVGELDLFVGRLEPGYAAPDLDTEALLQDGMCLICHPEHPLAQGGTPSWEALARLPWVMPPSWASSRVKLIQAFYRHRLEPPTDVVETASFLVTFDWVRRQGAIGFVARMVAERYQAEGLLRILPVRLRIELPPVGLITLHGRAPSPTGVQMIQALRATAREFLARRQGAPGERTPMAAGKSMDSYQQDS